MLTQTFLNKSIDDITEEDLTNFFIEEREESTQLEYKSFSALDESNINEKMFPILKTICAFLNSEGGMLIWGAPLGHTPEGRKEKIFVGELTSIPDQIEKDTFISKFSNRITPIPSGLLFKKVNLSSGFAYVIEASKSEISPHQLKDKFYMRLDGQTREAPYHYIEALFKKVRYPNLTGFVKLMSWKLNTIQGVPTYTLGLQFFFFNLSKLQNDYNISYRVMSSHGQFHGWNFGLQTQHNLSFEENGAILSVQNLKEVIHYGEMLHESRILHIPESTLEATDWHIELFLYFGAKNSPMKVSTYKLHLKNNITADYNEWIEDYEENVLMSDLVTISDEEKIRNILGR